MKEEIINFLQKERVGVVSVKLSGGSVHSATVHYSHVQDPLKIFIQTSNTTLKAQPFLNGQTDKGSMVVGFSEDDFLTLQMHGEICIVSDSNSLENIYKIHYQKHPDAEQYKGPDSVFLEFTPTWWRYTDFNTNPETILDGGNL